MQVRSLTRQILHICITFACLMITAGTAAGSCTVDTSPVTFGVYDVFASGPLDAKGRISVTCDNKHKVRVRVSIGPSQNSGSFDPRRMKKTGSGDMLDYNLYKNSARTKVWGDGSGNTFTVRHRVGRRKPWVRKVYGRIPPRQDVSTGQYGETLVVTITW